MPELSSQASQFQKGVLATLPLVIAAFPFGVVYGAMAEEVGLSFMLAVGMSALVFGGASQFIAVTLLAAGAVSVVIVATIFVVNLRHMLYSANLMTHVSHWPQRWRVLLSFVLTDETFATVSNYIQQQPNTPGLRWFYFGSAAFMYSFWILASALGFWLAETIPNLSAWGLEVAMIVAFVGIVVPAIKTHAHWACALSAFVTMLLCYDWPYQLGLLFAVLVSVVVGLMVRGKVS